MNGNENTRDVVEIWLESDSEDGIYGAAQAFPNANWLEPWPDIRRGASKWRVFGVVETEHRLFLNQDTLQKQALQLLGRVGEATEDEVERSRSPSYPEGGGWSNSFWREAKEKVVRDQTAQDYQRAIMALRFWLSERDDYKAIDVLHGRWKTELIAWYFEE